MVSLPEPEPISWLRKSAHSLADSCGMFLLLILANLLLCDVLEHWLVSGIDSDEVEHVHVTWALNQGIMPYRDIHQNHTPAIWLVMSPILAHLPETAKTVIALRASSVLAIVGIYLTGLLVLKELVGAIDRYHALSLSLVLLSMVPTVQFYRFRPDPWMAFFSALAILAAIRLSRNPRRYAFLCGLSLGIAASFSPKMAPLCLLVPVLCWWECFRRKSLRPLLLIIPNAVGFMVGILPVLAWIVSHGLFSDFREWCFSGNVRELNFDPSSLIEWVFSPGFLAVPLGGAPCCDTSGIP